MLVLAPAAFGAKGFSFGVASGDVTARSAILWAKARQGGTYGLEVANKRGFRRGVVVAFRLKAKAGNDFTLQQRVKGLKPGKRYRYRFTGRQGRRGDTGTFVTAPSPRKNATVEFAWTGDTDFSPEPGQTSSFWNSGQIFRRILAERNDFNVHLGDTIYSDSEVPGALEPIALTVEQKWAKYRTNLSNPRLARLRGAAAFYSHWDDHEFVNDFSPAENTFSNDVNINGAHALRAQRSRLQGLRAGHVQPRARHLPVIPLGAQRRAFLPRPALVPGCQGRRGRPLQQPADRRARLRSDHASERPQCVRGRSALADRAGVAAVPGRDPQPQPRLSRGRAVQALHQGDPEVEGPLQDHRQRDADSAVLRSALRSLGGLRS